MDPKIISGLNEAGLHFLGIEACCLLTEETC